MADKPLWLIWVLVVACLVPVVGCKGVQVVESSGSMRWFGMGVSLSLPAGSWAVEEVEPGHVVMFQERGGPGRFVVMRLPSREDEAATIALKSLFVHFTDKREIARRRKTLSGGVVAECADYSVKVEGRGVRVTACVARQGRWKYVLAAWGLEKSKSVPARLADAVLDSIAFSGDGSLPEGEAR